MSPHVLQTRIPRLRGLPHHLTSVYIPPHPSCPSQSKLHVPATRQAHPLPKPTFHPAHPITIPARHSPCMSTRRSDDHPSSILLLLHQTRLSADQIRGGHVLREPHS